MVRGDVEVIGQGLTDVGVGGGAVDGVVEMQGVLAIDAVAAGDE